jgi:hypothetical protein
MQMKGPTGAKYSISDSGWMESEQFKLWFSDIFLEGTKNLKVRKACFMMVMVRTYHWN